MMPLSSASKVPALLIVSLAMLLNSSARAADGFRCRNTVDPVRAMIFIDTNFGLTEIHSAEQAACDRGETFIRLPAPIDGEKEAHQELIRLTDARASMEGIVADAKRTGCLLPTSTPEAAAVIGDQPVAGAEETDAVQTDPRCTEIIGRFNRVSATIDETTLTTEAYINRVKEANGGTNFIYAMVQAGFIEIAKRGIRPTSLIISGHSSGNAFGGRFGGIAFTSLQRHIKNAYAAAPELLSDLKSIYLWGCNTLNPYEPEKWIGLFPTLEMITGFQGSAPSNLNSSSWTILDRLLHLERGMVARLPSIQADSEVKSILDRVPGISGSVTAVYLHDIPGGRGWFYERVRETNETSGKTAWISKASQLLNAKECTPVADTITSDQAYVESIVSGSTVIGEETGSGTLREIYTRSRRNDVCRAALGFKYSADQIGLLLFWHGVKKNTMRMLAPSTSEIDGMLSSALASPDTLLSEVAAENVDIDAKTSVRKADLDKQFNEDTTTIARLKARLSLIAAAEALLPFDKHRKRELKRLVRRERKLKRKLKRGRDVKDALATVSSEVSHYQEALRISNAGGKSDYERTTGILSSWETHLAYVNRQLANTTGAVTHLDGEKFLADLRIFQQNFSPKSVTEISPMSYAEVREKHLARKEALKQIESTITRSIRLMGSMKGFLEAAKSWNDRFERTAILADMHCLNFLEWHEFLEPLPASAVPNLTCN